jgi:hypothetical protein
MISQFTSTLKDSELVSGVDAGISGISWDGTNTPWCGNEADKLYLTSGQFTSTIKTSEAIGGTEGTDTGISWDGTNTPWCGEADDKLYLQSGQFTSTLKDSEAVGAIELVPNGISWDGTNTVWCGRTDNKLYLTSGQFTSTLKTSEDITSVENLISGIESNDVTARLGMAVSADITLPVFTVSGAASGEDAGSITLPVITLNASEAGISTGDGTITLPIIEVGGFAFATISSGIGAMTLPAIVIESTAMQGEVGNLIEALISSGTLIVLARAYNGSAPECVVMNTKNLAVSEYIGYGFNSMTEFNGAYLIADQNGVYEADTSDTDNAGIDNYAIKAHIKTGRIDIHKNNKNKLANAWINYQTDGSIQMVSTGDKKATRTYLLPYHSGLSGINERRVKFEKGIRNRFFDFKIQNIIGSQLEIDKLTIMLEPVVSKRR